MLPGDEAGMAICSRVHERLQAYSATRGTPLYYLVHLLSPRESFATTFDHIFAMVSRVEDPWLDLAVEVATPDCTRPMFKSVIHEHLATGVRMVWVLDAEDVSMQVATQPSRWDIYHDEYVFSGGEVLPGFSCKVSELFG